jgi:E3 ubiquitin-protein ligase RNF181
MRFDFECPIGSGRMTYWTGSLTAFLKYPAEKQNAILIAMDRLSREERAAFQLAAMNSNSAPDFFQMRELAHNLVGDIDNPMSKPAPEITIVATALAKKRGENCPICWDVLDDLDGMAVATKCKHVFCKNCIVSWVAKNPTCPVCRGSTRNSLVHLGDRDLKTASELLEPEKEPPESQGVIRRSQRVQRVIDLM